MNAGTLKPSAVPTSPGLVRDIMHRDVVTIAWDSTVRELAVLLLDHGISGVPVIGEDGLVAGVVSLWDVIGLAAKEGQAPELIWISEVAPGAGEQSGFYGSLVPGRPQGSPLLKTIRPPLLERHKVSEIMTPAIFHVREETTIPSLARYLLKSKIHRALVMDHEKLVGVVTTTDLLEEIARQDAEF